MVIELQKLALNSNESTENLVRYTYAIATKVGEQKTRDWARFELDGYGDLALPKYRVVSTRLEAFHPVLGHRKPIRYANPESQRTFETTRLNMPLSELSHFAKEIEPIEMTLAPDIYYQIFRGTEEHKLGMEAVHVISQSTIAGLLGIVRTIVLDWSLELERQGVKGEGFEFTPKEKAIGSKIVVYGNYTQIFTQGSSNVAIATDGSTSSVDTSDNAC